MHSLKNTRRYGKQGWVALKLDMAVALKLDMAIWRENFQCQIGIMWCPLGKAYGRTWRQCSACLGLPISGFDGLQLISQHVSLATVVNGEKRDFFTPWPDMCYYGGQGYVSQHESLATVVYLFALKSKLDPERNINHWREVPLPHHLHYMVTSSTWCNQIKCWRCRQSQDGMVGVGNVLEIKSEIFWGRLLFLLLVCAPRSTDALGFREALICAATRGCLSMKMASHHDAQRC